MSEEKVLIFDTTLRDGEQSPGASLSIAEKLEIAKQLAVLGVDIIEAGFPVSSPTQFEATKLVAEQVVGPTIAGLARANEGDIESAGKAIAPAQKKRIHTFIATSPVHMKHNSPCHLQILVAVPCLSYHMPLLIIFRHCSANSKPDLPTSSMNPTPFESFS